MGLQHDIIQPLREWSFKSYKSLKVKKFDTKKNFFNLQLFNFLTYLGP